MKNKVLIIGIILGIAIILGITIYFKGTYCLGDSTSNTIDPNCAYNLEVINLDKYGNITILLKKQ